MNRSPLLRTCILVVDDDPLARSGLRACLEHRGFEVRLATDGEAAVEIYRLMHDRIDLVLMDIHMPRMDGIEALQQLQIINPNVACCFMTGLRGIYDDSELLQQGACAVLHKPFNALTMSTDLPRVVRVGVG